MKQRGYEFRAVEFLDDIDYGQNDRRKRTDLNQHWFWPTAFVNGFDQDDWNRQVLENTSEVRQIVKDRKPVEGQ